MPLNLHAECKARLIALLEQVLPEIKVSHGQFLDRASAVGLEGADKILPNPGEARSRLIEYIGEQPFYDFVYESIARELLDKCQYNSDEGLIEICSIDLFFNSREVASRLVNQFDSLPWTYTISVGIPESAIKQGINFSISDSIKITKGGEALLESFPLETGNEKVDSRIHRIGLLSIVGGKTWPDGSVLQVTVPGFVGNYGGTTTSLGAEQLIKSLFGICIALRMFKRSNAYFFAPPMRHAFVHRAVDGRWVLENRIELDRELSEAIARLQFDDMGVEAKDHINLLAYNLGKLRFCFSNQKNSERTILAGQWLFESTFSNNELLSFVQATIALEILLGDAEISDAIGLGMLIRNRCAYFIGDSHSQREELLRDFGEIYKVRSSIVHRGKNKLSQKERLLLFKLRWIVSRVIQEEINLLEPEKKGV